MVFPEITSQSLRGKPEFSKKKKKRNRKNHVKVKCQEITVNRLRLLRLFSP